MLSLGIKGFRPRDPLTDPFRIARGLRGYTHWVRSRAPSGLEGLPEPQAPDRQEFGPDPWLPLGLWRYPGPRLETGTPSHRGSGAPQRSVVGTRCQLLLRQGHARGMTQEDKLLHWLQGFGGFRARTSSPQAGCLPCQEANKWCTWWRPV
jgi:hypothetical protein